MATTKIPVELSSTPGIVDNSNATAITIDSSENTTFAGNITSGALSVTSDTSSFIRNSTDNDLKFTFVTNNASDFAQLIMDGKDGGSEKFMIAYGSTHGSTPNMLALKSNDSSAGSVGFFTNSTERARFDVNGRFGIGTTSPTSPLTVKSNSTSSGNSGLRIEANGSTDAIIKMGEKSGNGGRLHMFDSGVEKIAFYTDGTANHISAGNVGIGTQSPTDKVQLLDSGSLALRVESTGTTNQASVWTENNAGTINGMFVYGSGFSGYGAINGGEGAFYSNSNVNIMSDSSSGVIKFSTGSSGGSERMRIDSNGRVGIKQSPGANNFTLQVTGMQTDGTDGRVAYFKGYGTQTSIGSTGPTVVIQNANTTANNYAKLSFESGNAGETVSINAQNIDHTNHYGDMAFNTRGSGGYSEKMRITSNGIVDINKASFSSYPTGSKLNVYADGEGIRLDGTGATTRRIRFRNVSDSNPGVIIADGSLKLETEDANTDIRLSAIQNIEHTVTSTNSTAGHHIFKSYNTEIMRIDGGNNSVGIGTTSPAVTSKLHVYKASAGTPHYDTYATQIIEDTEARLQLMSNDGGNNAAGLLLSNEDKHWGIANHGTGGAHRFAIGYYDSSSNGDFLDAQEDIFNIKTNGNIGIGTTSPDHKLTVNGSAFDGIQLQSAGSDCGYLGVNTDTVYVGAGSNLIFHTGNAGLTNGTERMRIDSSGHLILGSNLSTTEAGKLSIYTDATNDPALYGYRSTSEFKIVPFLSNGAFSSLSSVNDSGLFFSDNFVIAKHSTGNYGMKVFGDGNITFGTKVAQSKYTFQGVTTGNIMTIATGSNANANVGAIIFRDGADDYCGQITCNGGTNSVSYVSSSDYRLKENVNYTWDATTRLKQLKPVRFNWIDDDTNTLVDGFLAHEVSNIVPEAVNGEKDAMKEEEYEVTPAKYKDDGETLISEAVTGTRKVPVYQGIDHSKLVPLLVKTIQELEARIKVLEDK